MRRLPLLALLLLPACTVGEIGDLGGGDDTSSGDDISEVGPDAAPAESHDFTMAMTPPTITTTLGTTSHFTLTLTSDNFTGPVTLALTGVPSGWTPTITPANPIVPLDGMVTVDVAIAQPQTMAGATATIGVSASAAGIAPKTGQSTLTVTNDYIVTIPAGTGTGSHSLPGTLNLVLGATLHIKNGDTTLHRIHSDGGLGFPHQDTDMAQGEEYTVTPGEVSSYSFYCHDHGVGTGVTNLLVQ